MTTTTSAKISRSPRVYDGQNPSLLQAQALSVIQQFAGDTWTDHNANDPGITLLETLSFVISDLSYRLSFPIRDMMAWPDKGAESEAKPFWLAEDILPSNAVTLGDYQRLILDIPGIRVAQVALDTKSRRYQITVDTDNSFIDSDNEAVINERRLKLAEEIRYRFLTERNVNDDLDFVVFVEKHDIALSMDLVFSSLSDPVSVLVDILRTCQQVMAPVPERASLEMLMDEGKSADEVMQGVKTQRGFVRNESLAYEAFPKKLYSSDIFSALRKHSQLQFIRKLTFSGSESEPNAHGVIWKYSLPEDAGPQAFSLNVSDTLDNLTLSIDGQSYELNESQIASIKAALNTPAIEPTEKVTQSELKDLKSYQHGRYRQLKHYHSLQHEFPKLYKLIDDRLNGVIDSTELAQVMQLKGFLTLFDQMLADQFLQLEMLKKLLALPDQICFKNLAKVFDRMLSSEHLSDAEIKAFWQAIELLPNTYVSQPLTQISGVGNLLGDYFADYQRKGFSDFAEHGFSDQQLNRLNRSLSHLLARYSESTLDANLLQYAAVFKPYLDTLKSGLRGTKRELIDEHFSRRLVALKQVVDKSNALMDYPRLSRNRAGAFNYLMPSPKTNFVSSLSHRILRSLGVSDTGVMPLATGNKEGFYLLESELLNIDTSEMCGNDLGETTQSNLPHSTLYFVYPVWPTRFAHSGFKSLLEQQIKQHTPVHQNVKRIPLDRQTMNNFEQLYYAWLNAMTQSPMVVKYGAQHLCSGKGVGVIHEADDYSDCCLKRCAALKWRADLSKMLRTFLNDPESTVISLTDIHKVISEAKIKADFRVNYAPLPFLRENYAIGDATINPQESNKKAFSIHIKSPYRI